MTMKDKVILVTGANRGIGLNILQRLDTDGYAVIGTSRSDDGKNLISQQIKKLKWCRSKNGCHRSRIN